MKSRVVWVDSLKGVLIILVVWAHSIANVIGDASNGNYWWCLIYSFHMPAFMSVSGYLAYRPNWGGQINVCPSVVRRFKQLLVPFLLWSVFYFAIRGKITSYANCILTPVSTFWFLWALFFISAIFLFFRYFSKRFKVKLDCVLLIVCVVFTGALVVFSDLSFLGIKFILYYFIFYVMGYYISKWNVKSDNLFVIVLLSAIWFLLASFWRPNSLPDFIKLTGGVASLLRFVYKFVVAAVAVVAVFSLSPKCLNVDNTMNHIICLFGKYSLGIYVIHLTLEEVAKRMIAMYVDPNWFGIMVLFVALMIASVLIVWLLNKNKWTAKVLLGKF